jgi:D-alanyl-lipoteichoic acid acyltransferase DltB (MBOAT superfamily)
VGRSLSFASLPFVLLVLPAALAYSLLPVVARPWVLLMVGLVFYATFNWGFVFILIGVVAMTWAAGLVLAKPGWSRRVPIFVVAIMVPLIFYKYLLEWFDGLHGALLPTSNLAFGGYGAVLIPVGLSFFTFQALGYVLDVARGRYAPERNPFRLCLFVSFFPQLLAGPIERYPDLAPQLRAAPRPTPEMVLDGLVFLFYGLFLKVCIGDRLGVSVDNAFAGAGAVGWQGSIVGIYGFTFQLFADFCGYSLMALGAGRLFGIRLTANFRQPFLAGSITEFWQRWHVTLTRWVGDYIYRPLGARLIKVKALPRFVQEALTAGITWIAIGLWHGASLPFLVFGAGQAVLMLSHGQWARRRRGRAPAWRVVLGTAITFNLVAFGFGLIRAPSLDEYGLLVDGLFTARDGPLTVLERGHLIAGIAVLMGVELVRRYLPRLTFEDQVWPRCVVIVLLVLAIVVLGYDQGRAFIYFRF